MLISTPGQKWLGVFLFAVLFFSPSALAQAVDANCRPNGELVLADIRQVVDGDTLRLTDGRLVRLVGINTPELGRDGRPAQPLAERARREAEAWLGGNRVWLETGGEDHYGRLLASVYRVSDQRQLGEYLLTRGLGWQVVVPPNSHHADCQRRAEQRARRAGLGVWTRYPVLAAATLTPDQAGFQRVQGRVSSVSDSRRALWIELDGRLSLRLAHSDLAGFDPRLLQDLRDRELTVRGWLIYRGKHKRGFPAHMMHLRHPAMLELAED